MKIKKNLTIVLAIVLAIVLFLKVFLIIYFKTYAYPEIWEFEVLVNNMLSGKGLVYHFLGTDYRSFNTPLYSFICLAIYAVTNHNYFVVLVLQSLFTVFFALAIFSIAKMIFSEKVGFIAAVLASIHPGYMYYDAFHLAPSSIDAFFITIVTLLFLRFRDTPTLPKMLAIGALIGLGSLSRGILGALLPFLAVYFIVFVKGVLLRKKFKFIMMLALGTFIVIAPLTVRNYIIHKQFVLITSTTGETFWRGNNNRATGNTLTADGKTILDLWPKEFKKKIYSLDEMGQKKFFEKEAMDFIRNNPLQFIKLYFKKIYYFWWFSPQSGFNYPKMFLVIYRYIYSILIVFSILGAAVALLFRGRIMRNDALLLVFIFMSICLTQSLFFVEGRHRFLIEPLLMIFFSYGVTESYKFFKETCRRRASCRREHE